MNNHVGLSIEQEFLQRLALDVVFVPYNTLKLSTELEQLEDWDSLAVVATVGLADTLSGVRLSGESIAACRQVGDLLSLILERIEPEREARYVIEAAGHRRSG